jgi:hypothetical protein
MMYIDIYHVIYIWIYQAECRPMMYQHMQVEGARVGQISTGIMHPERGYADGFNFFDPDSYLTVQALGLASNAYLDEQVRAVIERTGMFLCPSGGRVGNETCLTDQVPHHFIKDVPVYTAISGERQTGPNVFWTLAALSHGKQTGDLDWLCAYIPTLRKSLRFLKVDKPLAKCHDFSKLHKCCIFSRAFVS